MQELINFSLSGNIVHSVWFKTIRAENGKADLVAINILAEIVYWYKPIEVRDELTGQHIGWRNKYRKDLLQKSYASLAAQFGLSERQVKAAVVRLEELGVITRVFRTINANGMILNNVLYIQLNFEKLKEISTDPEQLPCDKILSEGGHENVTGGTRKRHTPSIETSEGGHENVIGGTRKCHTNTEITTKNTTEITTETSSSSKMAEAVVNNKDVIQFFEDNFYLLKRFDLEVISSWCETYDKAIIIEAMKAAKMKNIRNLTYIERLLIDWEQQGIGTPEALKTYLSSREKRGRDGDNQPRTFKHQGGTTSTPNEDDVTRALRKAGENTKFEDDEEYDY